MVTRGDGVRVEQGYRSNARAPRIQPRAKLHYKQAAAWGFCILLPQPPSHCLLSSPVGGPAGTCGLESVKELVCVNTAFQPAEAVRTSQPGQEFLALSPFPCLLGQVSLCELDGFPSRSQVTRATSSEGSEHCPRLLLSFTHNPISH